MGVGVGVDVNTRAGARPRVGGWTGLGGNVGSVGMAHTVRLRSLCISKIGAVGRDSVNPRCGGDLELQY